MESRRASSATLLGDVIETSVIVRDYDPSGNKMINNYIIIAELGRGMHGKVKLAIDSNNEKWAIKIVDKVSRRRLQSRLSKDSTDPQLEKIRREIAILKKCSHPNVVRLKEVIDDPQAEKIYLVLEYLEGGDILWNDRTEVPKPIITIPTAQSIFRDLLSGIDYLHYNGIVHRDIKPANLLWSSDGTVKLADFGVSVLLNTVESLSNNKLMLQDEIELAKTAGSPAFFAPELCKLEDENDRDQSQSRGHSAIHIGAAIDVWAMGVTLYCIIFGKLPFIAETEFELFQIIAHSPLEFPPDVQADDSVKDLLSQLLEKDPRKRISVYDSKYHPWTTANLTLAEKTAYFRGSDPTQHQAERVHVSEEELKSAFTVVQKIRKQLRKLSASFQNLTASLRRRTVSMPLVPLDLPPSPSASRSHGIRRSKTKDKRTSLSSSFNNVLVPAIAVSIVQEDDAIIPKRIPTSIQIQSPIEESLSPKWNRWQAGDTPVSPIVQRMTPSMDMKMSETSSPAETFATKDDELDLVEEENERIRQWSLFGRDEGEEVDIV